MKNYIEVETKCGYIETLPIANMIVSVKKGATEMRRQILKAVIVRQRRPFRRPDGLMVQFEDNAAVIITETGETKGTMIKGAVAIEAAERWPKIAALAATIM